jgi:hypothetical protein
VYELARQRVKELLSFGFLFDLMILIPIMTGVLASAINRLASPASAAAEAVSAQGLQP